MNVYHGLTSLIEPFPRCVLTIGNFDGVHLAHQQLIATARRLGQENGEPVVVMTFEPHPLTVVAPERVPPRLTSLDQRLALIGQCGADTTVVVRSEPSLLDLEPETFIEGVLKKFFQPTHIVEGPTFGFGKQRRGDVALLRREAARFRCEVIVVDPVSVTMTNGERVMVSSSLIRKLLAAGQIADANRCLGRSYALSGVVIHGDRRGTPLGFPTANLGQIEQMVPADGVYAGHALLRQETLPAAISVGTSPTFGGVSRRVEAHILDFDGDLYGQPIVVEFAHYLRPQRKFDSSSALVEQLGEDVANTRAIVAKCATMRKGSAG